MVPAAVAVSFMFFFPLISLVASIKSFQSPPEQAPPEPQFRVPPEETVNQDESDQILFVIVGVFIAILISIILIDFIARKRKTVTNIETTIAEQQVISSKPSSDSTSSQTIDDSGPDKKDSTTSLEVEQATKVLQNLADKNMLDDPKTAKQFLLMKGFSKDAVKNAMISMGIDSSHVADLE